MKKRYGHGALTAQEAKAVRERFEMPAPDSHVLCDGVLVAVYCERPKPQLVKGGAS